MPRFLILAQSGPTARGLEAWREILGGERIHGIEHMPSPIIFDPRDCGKEAGAVAYETLVHRIESAAGLSGGCHASEGVVVLVDSVRPSRLTAVQEDVTWDHLIAMLVLTFPDLQWVFGVMLGESGAFPAAEHSLASLLNMPRREPLLDPTGLRNWVKAITNAALQEGKELSDGRSQGQRVPERIWRAASVDEEVDFAIMHGYAAYRFGFRTEVVTTWALMERLFGVQAVKRGGHGFTLLLEDMRLTFPDKPTCVHLSRLRKYVRDGVEAGRAHHCPSLDEEQDSSKWRFLVTTGQIGEGSNEADLILDNEAYLTAKAIGRGAVIYKPVGGIIDLWDKTGMLGDLCGNRRGNAFGFARLPTSRGDGPTDGHGSPGKLTMISASLLRRAGEVRKNADSIVGFIKGAVLAMDATELLGGKTPTLTLSGLLLKHEFEVKAECAFVGAGYHFGIQKRLDELEDEVMAVARWFHEDNRISSARDAIASILNRLVLAFREAGQVEEEQECLVALRRLNRKMSLPKNLSPLAWMSHAVLSYGEWLLGSFSRLALFTALWVVALAGVAWWIESTEMSTPPNPIDTVAAVLSWFVGGSAASDGGLSLKVLSCIGVIAGALHLGIFISYLYSLIARK